MVKLQAKSEFSAISVPAPGETECGDAWQLQLDGHTTCRLIVVDGLGHGPLAAHAAAEALAVFGEWPIRHAGRLFRSGAFRNEYDARCCDRV